jgi:hypothetical protein
MSPHSIARRVNARDGMIRQLTPAIMRAFNVDREVAILALSSISEDERLAVRRLRGFCLRQKQDAWHYASRG